MHTNELYFVGIALPEGLQETLADLQKRLYEPESMLKPIPPHITLLHPVSLLYVSHEELLPKMHKIAEKFLPLKVTLSHFDHFDNRTFHIVVNHIEHDLHELYRELVRLLPNEIRARHYSQAFHPHITICHSRTGELHHHSLHERAKEHFDLSDPRSVKVDSLSLFKHAGPREYLIEKI